MFFIHKRTELYNWKTDEENTKKSSKLGLIYQVFFVFLTHLAIRHPLGRINIVVASLMTKHVTSHQSFRVEPLPNVLRWPEKAFALYTVVQ